MGANLSATALLDPAVVDEPYEFYRRLVVESPVWHVPGTDVVIVSSFDAVNEAVKRIDDFSSNLCALLYRTDAGTPGVLPFDMGEGVQALATADPPAHTLHRHAVFPELVARRMGELRPDIEALTKERIDAALADSPLEFMGEIANAIPIRVVSWLIGFRNEDPDALLAAAFDSTAMLAATESLEGIQRCLERSADSVAWIGDQLQRAMDQGADGILGAIATAVAGGDLQLGEGLVIMHTLLSAGGESTTSLLGNAVHLLATRPDLQDRLRTDPELVTPFVEEVLRLESPFRYHMRHVAGTSELQGVSVPTGSTMLLFWGAANRDPAEYERPDDVILDRASPRHHVGFGRGIHLCVGAPLARLEADVVLTRFLERTSSFTLDPDHPPVRVDSLMVRRFESLLLRIERGER